MPFDTIQYQAFVEPIFSGPEAVSEDKWHEPWSEPVRYKTVPKLAIALIASGLFFTPQQAGETVNPDKWFAPLSEPVKLKPGLRANLQQFLTTDTSVFPTNSYPTWFAPLSEPVRLKPGLHASRQMFESQDTNWNININKFLLGYNWWSEPVRQRPGLKIYLQQTVAMPPRILPTPNVTVIMAATETNQDMFLGAINVYSGGGTTTSGQGAKVGIVEIPPDGGDPVSIRES